MEPSSSNLVDLCLRDILQDIAGDGVTGSQAVATWREAQTHPYTTETQEDKGELVGTNLPDAEQEQEPATAQEADTQLEDASEPPQSALEQSDPEEEQPSSEYSMPGLPEENLEQSVAEQMVPAFLEGTAEQPLPEDSVSALPEDTTEQPAASSAARQETAQVQKVRSAATLSKELRKLQAETTVLQEHSRRLQEKATVIQQQRAANQNWDQPDEYIKQLSLREQEPSAEPNRYADTEAIQQADRQADRQPSYTHQSSDSAGSDREPSYMYSSDATVPSQDGALQWSIGGVPLQQQLRLLSADNGMEAEEASSGRDPPQGLQWSSGNQAEATTLKKKKSVAISRQPRDMQAGKMNSIAALHDAHSKQLLKPLKMRKAHQGNAANPVIRQRSVAQQAKHKQHFADTLRRSSAEAAAVVEEHSMQSGQSMPAGQSMHSMQSVSLDFQTRQAQDGAEQAGAYYRAQLEPYGSPLASSKSEPHGLFSKSAAQLYAAQLASSGLPKANSVHDLDMGMGMAAPQPAVTKRRAKPAAQRNAGSAPGPYAQGWSQGPAQPQAFPPGLQGSMYSHSGLPLLPQLGPGHMGMQQAYMAAPQATQQSFAPQGPPQGLKYTTSRRNPGRQAGSALAMPDMGSANSPYGSYTMQQQQQQQAGMMQGWGGPFAAAQPQYPMQYPQNTAAMRQPQAMPNGFGGYPPAAPGGYPGVQSTSMLPKRGKNRGNAFGQPNQQAYAGAAPMAGMMQPGYPNQAMGGMPQIGGAMPQMGGAGPWGNGMQQRADAMQQYQLQHYQQMQNNVVQHLQQNQNHALLKYGNFDHATYRQSDINSRPEFRTY